MSLFKDQILKDTGILFLANSLANLFNFAFQIVMVRRLSAVDYGVFNSLLSIFVILSISFTTTQTVIAKFVSEFSIYAEIDKIRYFLTYLGKRLILLASIIFIILIIFQDNLSGFLNIDSASFLLILLAASIFISLILPLGLGGLQGLERFGYLGLNNILDGAFKLLAGLLFVKIGWGVLGAMSAFTFSVFMSLVFVLLSLYWLLPKATAAGYQPEIDFKKVYKFIFPVAITLFSIMAMTNIDVILVKHYFRAYEAGVYSIAQMVGKIIFFLPGVLVTVIFPKSSKSSAKREDASFLLVRGIIFSGLICCGAAIICLVLPEIILKLLSGRAYPEATVLVRLFSITMLPYAMINLILYYLLSVHKLRFIYPLIFFTILEVLLITIFHSHLEFILYIMLGVGLLLLTILFGLLKYDK